MDPTDFSEDQPVYIFLNGPLCPPPDLPTSPVGSYVIAVDGGALHCLRLKWPVHLLLGDFDSLTEKGVGILKEAFPRLEIRRYNREKDESDFELALKLLDSQNLGHRKIIILGGLGGRWDMTLSNLLLPLAPNFKLLSGPPPHPELVFRDGQWDIHLLSGPTKFVFRPQIGDRRVSLVPLKDKVTGITLSGGFKYPLSNEDLFLGLTRSLCNELDSTGGTLSLTSGTLLVTISPLDDEGFRPEAMGF
ncbi:MAG: thiamine diphosphokinase [Deltaproteobacteria bacterium]|jgi:thiamine pyrophosphokinase|nr:thiamine diphosphokinase [Deltaproteobacteria bacterium]